MLYFLFVTHQFGIKAVPNFGESKASKVALAFGLPLLGRLPVDPAISEACDNGEVENLNTDRLMPVTELIEEIGGKKL